MKVQNKDAVNPGNSPNKNKKATSAVGRSMIGHSELSAMHGEPDHIGRTSYHGNQPLFDVDKEEHKENKPHRLDDIHTPTVKGNRPEKESKFSKAS